MASGRMLKKEISDSEKLGAVKSDRARVLYFMMLPHLDIAGRLEANTRRIKGQITTMLPYTEKAIQAALEHLCEAGLIVLYTDSDKQYLQFTRFDEFQSLNPEREAKSTIPGPTPDNSRVIESGKSKLSKVKLSLSKDKYKANSGFFDEVRKFYNGKGKRGTVGGNKTEFDNFIKKYDNWEQILPLLKPAIEKQIIWREKANGEFRPQWKNFQTWINGECWDEICGNNEKQAEKDKPKSCFVCKNVAEKEIKKSVFICTDCNAFLSAAPPFVTYTGKTVPKNRLELGQLEEMVLKQKAKKRSCAAGI